jgi:hypothetical protein
MARIAELEAEVERLKAGSDAHSTLQSIYPNPASPEGNRIKAAIGALPVEKPKIGSILPTLGYVSSRERWRLYELRQQRWDYITTHHDLPPKGWDAHLQPDTYTPPEGFETERPPIDLEPDPNSPHGYRVLTNLLPGMTTCSRNTSICILPGAPSTPAFATS